MHNESPIISMYSLPCTRDQRLSKSHRIRVKIQILVSGGLYVCIFTAVQGSTKPRYLEKCSHVHYFDSCVLYVFFVQYLPFAASRHGREISLLVPIIRPNPPPLRSPFFVSLKIVPSGAS